jgi:hypothetical protein
MGGNIVIGFLVVLGIIGLCQGASVKDDITLTRKQKVILDEFKEILKGKLPQEYMYEDIYLIRWLRAKNFRVKEAEAMLMQNVAWRKQEHMDNVLGEDWSEFRKQYKYWIDGVDKEGRPILFIDVGEWDLRKASVSGQSQKLTRYIDSIYEEINAKVRTMRLQEGKNVTQYYQIFDMEGFTLQQQGCPACIPLATRVVTTYENYFPGGSHKTVMVNTPGPFQTLFQIIKPLMSKISRDNLFIYGKKEEGVEALLKDISKDQLAEELGGSKVVAHYSS